MQIVACRDGLLDLCNSGNQFRRPVFKSEAPLVYFGRLASRFCHVREFKVGHEIAFHHELSGAHGTHIAIGCRVHVHPDLPICRDPPVCFVVLDQLTQHVQVLTPPLHFSGRPLQKRRKDAGDRIVPS